MAWPALPCIRSMPSTLDLLAGQLSHVSMHWLSAIDFDALWKVVISDFKGDCHSIHGPGHWRRVEANGLAIAASNQASVPVVRLFALFHDSCRVDDGSEFVHGELAAQYAASLRGKLFDIDDESFGQLQYACQWHTHGNISSDPTIGACWDADRLDLTRIGILPNPRFLSTDAGRHLAAQYASRPSGHPDLV